MKLRRLFPILVILLLAVCVLVACGDGQDETDPPDAATTTAPPAPLEALAYSDLAEYVIVYPIGISAEEFNAVRALINRVEEIGGVRLDYKEDIVVGDETVPTDTKEILIGATNRAESSMHFLAKDDYGVWYENDRFVIGGGSAEALINGIHHFAENYVAAEGVRRSRTAELIRTDYRCENVTIDGVPISEYVIVRDTANAALANYLRNEIANATGHVLEFISPRKSAENGREIVLGDVTHGNRTPPAVSDGRWQIAQIGTRLYLNGDGSDGLYFAIRSMLSAFGPESDALTINYTEPASGASENMALFSLNLAPTLGSMAGKYEIGMTPEAVMARFFLARAELPDEVTVIDPVSLEKYPLSAERELYVSPSGDDAAVGTLEAPLATLNEAVSRMKNAQGGVIWMMEGDYTVEETVSITRAYSGMRQAPLFIKAYQGGEVNLTTNKTLSTDEDLWHYFDIDDNPDVFDRVPEEVRDYIFWTTLEEQGLTAEDIPAITAGANGRAPTLFVNGAEYHLARYPNSNEPMELLYFTKVYDTGRVTARDGSNLYWPWVARSTGMQPDGSKTEIGWEIAVLNGYQNGGMSSEEGMRAEEMAAEILSWVNTGDIWYYGSAFEGWEFGCYNLALTHTEAGMTTTWAHYEDANKNGVLDEGEDINGNGELDDTPYLGYPRAFAGDNQGGYANDPQNYIKTAAKHPDAANGGTYYSLKATSPCSYGAKHSTNSPAGRNTFYLFNAIEALDEPGEWFYDRATDRLYIYPEDEDAFFEGGKMSLWGEAFDLFSINNTANVVVDGLTVDGVNGYIFNVSNSDSVVLQNLTLSNAKQSAVTFRGSTANSALIYSDVSATYVSMVQLSLAASSYNLTPTNVVVQNNVFHDSKPTVQTAVTFSGCRSVISHNYFNNTTTQGSSATECILEYNRFEGGSKDVVDGGMIYCGGHHSRGNHYRYNLFHMFNATHNAIYNDGMGSGHYAYGNVISTLGSESNSNKGWYSSTGVGNVCYGNVMVLRNPYQVAAAGSSGGDEGDVVVTGKGDSVNQSALFYYYFGDQYSAGGAASRYFFVDYSGNPILSGGGQAAASQSLAGHWWRGNRDGELKLYFQTSHTEAWADRYPDYINYLYGTRLILAALDQSDYRIKYFYAPWYLTGKTFTYDFTEADGTVPSVILEIPEYSYLDGSGELVTVAAQRIEVPEDGQVTLTYEEIAAMERFRRQPAACVISNNVLLGGTPTKAGGVYTETADPSQIITDSAEQSGYFGYVPTALIERNYFDYNYDNVMYDAENYDYDLREEVMEALKALMSEDGFATVTGADMYAAGVTYEFDYGEWEE